MGRRRQRSGRGRVRLGAVLGWIRRAKIINVHTVKIAAMILGVLWVTNPSLIPFLPQRIKTFLMVFISEVFGNVEEISKVLPVSWVSFFQIIVMLLFLWLVMEIAKAVLEYIPLKSKRMQTFRTVILSTIHYIFAIAAVIWALKIIGINTATIFAGVGIVSLIVGFGADSLVADMVTGVFLLFDNQYNVGDILDVGDFHGCVVKIGFRSTWLRDEGGSIKIINNSNMCDIVNRSGENSLALCDIAVPAGWEIEKIEASIEPALAQLKEEHNIFLEKPEYWGVESVGSEEMTLRVVAWVIENDVYKAQRLMNRAVQQALQKIGVWGKEAEDAGAQ